MKRAKKLSVAMLILCMLLANMMSTAMADYSGEGPYGFDLQPGGEREESPIVRKTDNANYARVEVEDYDNLDSDLPFHFRVRKASGIAAMESWEVNGMGTYRRLYFTGYGVNGESYVLRAQADSTSTYGGETGGIWSP